MCEENVKVAKVMKSNPEVLFLKKRILIYESELTLNRIANYELSDYDINAYQKLISCCKNKINIIIAFEVSRETHLSMKQALKAVVNSVE